MGPRAKEVSLVLCIVLLACTIALASERLVPPVFGVKIQPITAGGPGTGLSPGSSSKVGTLLIEASVSGGLLSSGIIFPTPYMSDAGVTVVPTGPAPLFAKTYTTNSTGGLELSLPPSNYSVSFFASADSPINASVLAPVYQGETTVLQLAVTDITYQPVYVSIPTNQTDVAPAYAPGTMELSSQVQSSPTGAISEAFLDLYYNTGSVALTSNQTSGFSLKSPVQIPVLVDGWSPRQQGSGAEQWINFQPETPVSLAGLASMAVSMYYVLSNVTTVVSMSPSYYGGASSGS